MAITPRMTPPGMAASLRNRKGSRLGSHDDHAADELFDYHRRAARDVSAIGRFCWIADPAALGHESDFAHAAGGDRRGHFAHRAQDVAPPHVRRALRRD